MNDKVILGSYKIPVTETFGNDGGSTIGFLDPGILPIFSCNHVVLPFFMLKFDPA